MPATSSRFVTLLTALVALLGALGLGWIVAGQVEARAAARLSGLMGAAGLGWVDIGVDGSRVTLSGQAPDSLAALSALNVAREAGAHIAVRDRLTVRPRAAVPDPTPGFALDLLRDEQGIALAGTVPNASVHDALLGRLRDISGGTAPLDLLREAGLDTPPGWDLMLTATVAAARGLLHGRVSMTSEGLAISGLPRNGIGRAAIVRHAARLEEAGLTATLDLVPPPARDAGAYIFSAERSPAGGRVVDCTMPGTEAATAVNAAAASLIGARPVRCRIDTAVPAPGWVEAVQAGLAALAEASSARFEIEAETVRLIPGPEAIGPGFDAAVSRLQASLPQGFSLVAAPADTLGGSDEGDVGLWLRARLADGRLVLGGTAPDESTRAAVTSYAAARFGADRVSDSLTVSEGTLPEGWRTAALAGIDALAAVERGETVVRDGRIRLWGSSSKPEAARLAQAALAPMIREGWTGTTRVTIDLPGRVAALKLNPDDCIAALDAVVTADPILFAPSSATIEAESEPVVDRLAETLGRCAALRVEVGGHTDSQGSAAYNNRLSQARAEAVRAALIERGAAAGLLEARGYGPSQPIADNRTEAGRALNRRIAFRSLEAPAEPAPAAAVLTAGDPPAAPPIPEPRP